MATDTRPVFSVDKVKALKAYFFRLRNSFRGKPEFTDLDTTVKLCDQLLSVMAENETLRAGQAAPVAPEKSAS